MMAHRWICRKLLGCASGLLLELAGSLQAHDPGLSTATLRLKPEAVEAVLTFALADVETLVVLDNDLDGKVSQLEFTYGKTKLGALAVQEFEVKFDDRVVMPTEPSLQLDDNNNVTIQTSFPGKATAKVKVRSRLVAMLPPGHRQFLAIQDANGQPLVETLLSAKSDTCIVDLADLAANKTAASPTHSFWDFLLLGIKHILTGYDHLLFLVALLIVTANFLSAVKVVTCFTVAHSITLAVATLDLVRVPGRVVEPLIAATIVYVGIENLLRRGEPKGRWLLTFAFGLVHGFGFATVLRELGVASGQTGVVVPLFSFNLGVEVGQVTVAALVLPCVWKLKQRPFFTPRFVPVCSALVALAGSYWLIERTVLSAR